MGSGLASQPRGSDTGCIVLWISLRMLRCYGSAADMMPMLVSLLLGKGLHCGVANAWGNVAGEPVIQETCVGDCVV